MSHVNTKIYCMCLLLYIYTIPTASVMSAGSDNAAFEMCHGTFLGTALGIDLTLREKFNAIGYRHAGVCET